MAYTTYVPRKWYKFPSKESEFNPLLYFLKYNPEKAIEVNLAAYKYSISGDGVISWQIWSDRTSVHIITPGVEDLVLENPAFLLTREARIFI